MTSRLRTEADAAKLLQKLENIEPWQTVLVFYHADWCGPSHRIVAFFEELAMMHMQRCIQKSARPTITFLRITAESEPALLERHNVTAFPAFIWFLGQGKERTGELYGASRDRLHKLVRMLEEVTEAKYKTMSDEH